MVHQYEMPEKALLDFVQAAAQKYAVPGVAIEVTSIDNLLPVDPHTLEQAVASLSFEPLECISPAWDRLNQLAKER